jgi:hypothetical protein
VYCAANRVSSGLIRTMLHPSRSSTPERSHFLKETPQNTDDVSGAEIKSFAPFGPCWPTPAFDAVLLDGLGQIEIFVPQMPPVSFIHSDSL